MIKLTRKNNNLVFLYCDGLENQEFSALITQEYKRSFNFGLGISNMFSAGAGFAQSGKLPIVFISADLLMRGIGAFYTDVLLPNLNMKVVIFGAKDVDMIKFEGVKFIPDLALAIEEYGPVFICMD